MDVPLHIIEKGGETLRQYIETKKLLDEAEINLHTVEANIVLIMSNVDKLIGEYLPEISERGFNHDDFKNRKIIPHIHYDNSKAVTNVMAAEEYLKQLRPLLLERLEYESKKKKYYQDLKSMTN